VIDLTDDAEEGAEREEEEEDEEEEEGEARVGSRLDDEAKLPSAAQLSSAPGAGPAPGRTSHFVYQQPARELVARGLIPFDDPATFYAAHERKNKIPYQIQKFHDLSRAAMEGFAASFRASVVDPAGRPLYAKFQLAYADDNVDENGTRTLHDDDHELYLSKQMHDRGLWQQGLGAEVVDSGTVSRQFLVEQMNKTGDEDIAERLELSVNESEGFRFLVMRRYDSDLAAELRTNAKPAQYAWLLRAFRLAWKLGQLGIVHGDLKPDQFLVDKSTEPWSLVLADMGFSGRSKVVYLEPGPDSAEDKEMKRHLGRLPLARQGWLGNPPDEDEDEPEVLLANEDPAAYCDPRALGTFTHLKTRGQISLFNVLQLEAALLTFKSVSRAWYRVPGSDRLRQFAGVWMAPEEEETLGSAQDEKARGSAQDQKARGSAQDQKARGSAQDQKARGSAQDVLQCRAKFKSVAKAKRALVEQGEQYLFWIPLRNLVARVGGRAGGRARR
jgi:hypothetical protein